MRLRGACDVVVVGEATAGARDVAQLHSAREVAVASMREIDRLLRSPTPAVSTAAGSGLTPETPDAA